MPTEELNAQSCPLKPRNWAPPAQAMPEDISRCQRRLASLADSNRVTDWLRTLYHAELRNLRMRLNA